MINILLICVNYNTYKELDGYIESVRKSANKCSNVNLKLYIADNSTSFQPCGIKSTHNIEIIQERYNNLGYLGAALKVYNKEIHYNDYDYVIISNVDILMDVSFFETLCNSEISSDIGWIAPSIKSLLIDRDKNPSVLHRYSKWKLQVLKMTYNRFVLPLYEKLYYNKKQKNVSYPEMDIYAGHGSFFLLTKRFVSKNPILEYPMFLYGEELFFAELNIIANLKVRYMPSLLINDFEHVSTSLLHKSTYYTYNKKAINYILDHFYN